MTKLAPTLLCLALLPWTGANAVNPHQGLSCFKSFQGYPTLHHHVSQYVKREKIEVTPVQRTIIERLLAMPSSSITDLRQELKRVADSTTFDPAFAKLQEALKGKIELRDHPPAGTRNWNKTTYSSPLKYTVQASAPGESAKAFSVKPRNRIFLSENIATGKLERIPPTLDGSFLELKIEHPHMKAVSVKPRVVMEDHAVSRILSPSSSSRYFDFLTTQIRQNPRNRTLTEKNLERDFLEFFRLFPFDNPNFSSRYLTILNQRDAYIIRLKDTEIQITVDRDISLWLGQVSEDYINRGATAPKLATYPANARVVEVKIDPKYADFSPEALAQIPELRHIKNFIEQINSGLLAGFRPDTGKFSNLHRLVLENFP